MQEKAIERRSEQESIERLSELLSTNLNQQNLSDQLIENQQQLIKTQHTLVKLLDRSVELTQHLANLERRMAGLMELPRIVESLRLKVAELERVEVT